VKSDFSTSTAVVVAAILVGGIGVGFGTGISLSRHAPARAAVAVPIDAPSLWPTAGTEQNFAKAIAASNNDQLIEANEFWDDLCRGTARTEELLRLSCDRRETISDALNDRKVCHGKAGQATFQYQWHVCGPDSYGKGRHPDEPTN
jgi:hypothetical protein